MADLRQPARRIARSKPAGQILIFNVSKVASTSPTGAPALGQFLSFTEVGFGAVHFGARQGRYHLSHAAIGCLLPSCVPR
jgi:hypothetical protein